MSLDWTYYCSCGKVTNSGAAGEVVGCIWCGPPGTHHCKFKDPVTLFNSVVETCECGKERYVDWKEIGVKRKDKTSG